jgi:hypothetical protein
LWMIDGNILAKAQLRCSVRVVPLVAGQRLISSFRSICLT